MAEEPDVSSEEETDDECWDDEGGVVAAGQRFFNEADSESSGWGKYQIRVDKKRISAYVTMMDCYDKVSLDFGIYGLLDSPQKVANRRRQMRRMIRKIDTVVGLLEDFRRDYLIEMEKLSKRLDEVEKLSEQ